VSGLVLCATSGYFVTSREERLSFMGLSGLAAVARLTPLQARRWLTAQLYLQRKTEQWEPWAIDEASMHDWRAVLEAGRAIGSFSSRSWIGEVDVPTSVVITMRDRVVPVRRQVRLFESIKGAEAFRVDGDHDAENDLRSAALEFMDAVRAAERAMAATRTVGETDAIAEHWRRVWCNP
jgi:3-oxoadipate enol-lactonase